ncbi:sensor histidine kinase [Kibdelosporangium aridum]|uniref:histidine kinase n=1 Tax=Kibdelosporangium aridum TaxID=2030 RepID=A0A428Z0C8_KIBAR|nr:sensor histidine kinase [Kibdelosporangium aridum]RSM77705.1 sensor histidine kinase [Kibdelosporangium aridum]
MSTYRQWAVDIGVAVAVTALLIALVEASPHPLSVTGYTLMLTSSLSIALRRRFPVPVVLLCAICTVNVYILDGPDIPIEVPLLCALFSALRFGHRVIGIGTGVTYLLTMVVFNVFVLPGHPAREEIQDRILLLGWFVAAMVLGETARLREKRAVDQARNHEETLRRQAGEERLRIARELHDSLTHSISVIKVHAGVAIHLARKRGEEVPEALLAIQEASTDAVRELRETLSVLRGEPDSSGLDRLDDLVDRARSTGLPVQLTITGQQRPLPTEIDRAAYRIVQEALTNVTRHASADAATVHVGFGKRMLTLQIDDDGTATPDTPPVPGVGLIGMRERVTSLGGSLSAAPRKSGGFTVRAELPV